MQSPARRPRCWHELGVAVVMAQPVFESKVPYPLSA